VFVNVLDTKIFGIAIKVEFQMYYQIWFCQTTSVWAITVYAAVTDCTFSNRNVHHTPLHRTPCTTHHASHISHHTPHTTHHTPCITHHA
jgi:hypothetical protein